MTTNVDHCFQRTGFGKERLFYTQGDYGLFQCRVPCHDKTYDNEAVVLKMRKEEKNMTIPSALVPRCPVCGEPDDDEFALRRDVCRGRGLARRLPPI